MILSHGTENTLGQITQAQLAAETHASEYVWVHACLCGKSLVPHVAQAWNRRVVGFPRKLLGPVSQGEQTILRDALVDAFTRAMAEPGGLTAGGAQKWLREISQSWIDGDKLFNVAAAMQNAANLLELH